MMKKYTFLEALRAAMTIKKHGGVDFRRIRATEGAFIAWMRYSDVARGFKSENGHDLRWPDKHEQKAKIWQVEPEKIFVYGACDNSGESSIFLTGPERKAHLWDGYYLSFKETNLFPKDKPVKFELVPVEDE